MIKNYFLRKSIRLAFCVVSLLTASLPLYAQTFVVNQCSGTNLSTTISNAYGPMYTVATANATNRTAVIYPASQLTSVAGAPLTSVYYYRGTATGTIAGTPNFKVYLREVSQADWGASFTSWADTIASATLVYDGNPATIVGSSAGWKAFPFIANFNYSGTKNLAVLTEYTNATASAAIQWSYEFTSPCVNTSNSNTTKYSNNTTGTLPNTLGSSEYRRPYIGFDVFLTCYPPTGLSATSITTNSAQISWTASTSTPAGGYEYYYNTSNTAPTPTTTPSGNTASGITTAQLNGLASGTTYYYWVRSVCSGADKSPWSTSSSFQSAFNVPANDNICGAVALSVSAGPTCTTSLTNQTTGGATAGATACAGSGADDDVWYSFVATNTSTTITLTDPATTPTGSSNDRVHQIYSSSDNTCTGTLTSVKCSDPETSTTTGLVVGNTYFVRVHSYSTGNFTTFGICITVPPPVPANDNICGAIALSVSSGATCTTNLAGQSTQSSTAGATACVGSGADDDVWYSFVATNASATITLTDPATTPTGSSNDRVHQIYSSSDNTCTGTLTSVKCSDPETSTTTGLVVGNTYFVRVHSYSTGNFTTFGICVTGPATAPANDNASGAISLTVGGGCTGSPYTNVAATQGATEKFASCYQSASTGTGITIATHTVWFKFVAPAGGAVKVSTDITGGTLADTHLGLFSVTDANDYSTFTILSCDDDNGSVGSTRSILYATGLTPAQTYYVSLDGYNAAVGTFCVTVDALSSSMLATTATCASATPQVPSGAQTSYAGQVPLVDAAGNLIALVRNAAGGSVSAYSAMGQNINTGTVRQSNGAYYLDRNYRITNTSATNVDVQLFFLNTELAALTTADPTVTLANLGVTRQQELPVGCYNNLDLSKGAISFIQQSGNGTSGGASWISFTTPGFSNFYLNRAGTSLPITLQYLKGLRIGTGNALNWKVNCTSLSITMELERSSDSRSFKSIGSITATQARCGQPFDYTDAAPLKGTNYYRLKLIDVDGKITYSPIVAIINGNSGAELVGIYPTVVRDEAFVSVAASRSTKLQINITDMSGRIIKTISQTVANGSSLISINTANLSTGVYNITGMLDGIQTKTLRFVKQ